MRNKLRTLMGLVVTLSLCLGLTGCVEIESKVNDLEGSITGNTYECNFYSNTGNQFMTVEGTNIDINSNIVRERTYSSEGGWGYTKTLSSVLTLTIDGNQIESCGSSILFCEKGLEPDVDFKQGNVVIESSADGIGDTTIVANIVNRYNNSFGKPTVVVIQSQLGDPICAYSGDNVYWEVCQDLPKTTKLMIDGKALYIHRANFQIIDKALLN